MRRTLPGERDEPQGTIAGPSSRDPLTDSWGHSVSEECLDDVDRQLDTELRHVESLARNAGWPLHATMLALQELERDGAVLRWEGASVARVWVDDPPMDLVLCDAHRCGSEVEVPKLWDGKPDEDALEALGWTIRGLRTFCPGCQRQGHRRVEERRQAVAS